MATNIDQTAFFHFVEEIKQTILKAQYKALQSVNREQINLYWEIGRLIVERQQAHGWGKSIVENLALELQNAFPNSKGYSARNLWRMKSLFDEYSRSEVILPPMVAEIAWSHNILILEKCKNDHQRFFYLEMTRRHGWSKTALTNAIMGQVWENTLLNQQNFEGTMPPRWPGKRPWCCGTNTLSISSTSPSRIPRRSWSKPF